FDEGFGDEIAAGDAAEDVDENALHFGIAEDDAEGFVSRIAGDAAADIEEIGRLAAVELDNVHGGHREACAVDEAADGAVEGDVIEIGFAGADVEGFFLGLINHGGDVGMAGEGVVVEIEFG